MSIEDLLVRYQMDPSDSLLESNILREYRRRDDFISPLLLFTQNKEKFISCLKNLLTSSSLPDHYLNSDKLQLSHCLSLPIYARSHLFPEETGNIHYLSLPFKESTILFPISAPSWKEIFISMLRYIQIHKISLESIKRCFEQIIDSVSNDTLYRNQVRPLPEDISEANIKNNTWNENSQILNIIESNFQYLMASHREDFRIYRHQFYEIFFNTNELTEILLDLYFTFPIVPIFP